MGKISEELQAAINVFTPSDTVNVVVELVDDKPVFALHASKRERLACMKEHFEKVSAPVKTTITAVGGTVLGGSWLASILSCEIPVSKIDEVAALEQVEKIDLARRVFSEKRDPS